MEPFSPGDPLHTLLGKARPVEPRPNFTQNVMRAIRQEPQTQGVWERVQEWLGGLTLPRTACAAAALVAVLVAVTFWKASPPAGRVDLVQAPAINPETLATAIEDPMDSAMASELDTVDTLSVLLAQQDTSALTDSEIALLLY